MIINMTDSLTKLRGQYEDLYENQVLSADIIETIVDEFMMSGAWLKGVTPTDVISEGRTLKKTLKWQSEYNANDTGC